MFKKFKSLCLRQKQTLSKTCFFSAIIMYRNNLDTNIHRNSVSGNVLKKQYLKFIKSKTDHVLNIRNTE